MNSDCLSFYQEMRFDFWQMIIFTAILIRIRFLAVLLTDFCLVLELQVELMNSDQLLESTNYCLEDPTLLNEDYVR